MNIGQAMSDPVSTSFQAQKAARSDYAHQYEILVAALYNQIVAPGEIVVDGGANIGWHAAPLARRVGPHGLVIAFEPVPLLFKELERNVGGLAVELHQLALSDSDGTASFVVDDKTTALSHIRHHFDKPGGGKSEIVVETATIDNVVKSRKIDFIKLDLEGADFLAILGARATISSGRPPIIFENGRAWPARCYDYSADDFFSFFEQVNYVIYDLHGTALTRDAWSAKDVGFEFIALPGEAADANRRLLSVIDFFWREIDRRPLIMEWRDFLLAVGDAPLYMAAHHGENWLAEM